MGKKRPILALFLVLVALSAFATVTCVFGISVSSGAEGVCVSGAGGPDDVAYEGIVMGKPKPGDWS